MQTAQLDPSEPFGPGVIAMAVLTGNGRWRSERDLAAALEFTGETREGTTGVTPTSTYLPWLYVRAPLA